MHAVLIVLVIATLAFGFNPLSWNWRSALLWEFLAFCGVVAGVAAYLLQFA